jgi:hypothetical protein
MIRIQSRDLAAVITGLIRMLIVHVVRNPDLSENAGVNPHIIHALVTHCCKLMRKTVSNRVLSNLDGERRRKILASKHAKYIDVPDTVPIVIQQPILYKSTKVIPTIFLSEA